MADEVALQKKCTRCGKNKCLSEFHIRKETGKHRADCKVCVKEKAIEWRKNNFEQYKKTTAKYKEENKDHIDRLQLEHRQKNRQKLRNYAKDYHKNNRDKSIASNKAAYLKKRDINIQKKKEWYQNNKEKHAEGRTKYELANKDRLRAARRKWENKRLAENINYRLHKTLAGRVRSELKGVVKRTLRTEQLIGCTIEELKVFIEMQFTEGMSWDNWSTNGWHIDHRIPISWFNLENENCRNLAFSYKNLQPLWSVDNLEKKNFYAHKMAS